MSAVEMRRALLFAGSRVGRAGTHVSECRPVAGMPVIAALLAFCNTNRLELSQQCHSRPATGVDPFLLHSVAC